FDSHFRKQNLLSYIYKQISQGDNLLPTGKHRSDRFYPFGYFIAAF
ncbi:unnamed protein product, partial [Allacma fusca]